MQPSAFRSLAAPRRRLPFVAPALVVALVLVAALAASPGPARADGGAKSRIKIKKLRASGAKGEITSGKDRCLGGRKVTLFYYEGFVTRKAAITHSKRDGRWRVRKSLAPGRYFAKVDGAKRCRYDVSSTKRL